MQFSQENNKLKKLFESIKKNNSSLVNNKNDQIILDFFKQLNKPTFIFSDTGWLAKAPDANDLKTINKGDFLPESFSLDYQTDIEIPEFFLNFLEPVVLIKPAPDRTMTTYTEFSQENWVGDYIRVKGDGSLIYRGPFPTTANNLVSQQQIDDGDVPLNKTKKVYRGTIEWTDTSSGDDFTFTGEVVRIFTEENTQTCDVNTIFDQFLISPVFGSAPSFSHKITDLDDTGFTGVGQFTDVSFTGGPPSCPTSSTITDGTTLSKTFAGVDEYTITLQGSGTNITQGTPISGNRDILGSEITSKEITFQGYRPFYSTVLQREFTATSGIFLTNFPDTNQMPPFVPEDEVLPYTSITLERNYDEFPTESEITKDVFLSSSVGNIGTGNLIDKEYTYWRISDDSEGNLPKYRIKYRVGATMLAPATTEDPNPSVETQNDVYTVVGTTYSRTTDESGEKTNGTYVTDKQDVQYRILFTIKNPYFFEETRKYNDAT